VILRLLPSGPRAWLVELPAADVVGFARAVHGRDDPDVLEIVPAARTVLVEVAAAESLGRVGEWLSSVVPDSVPDAGSMPTVEIAVRYDGEDLADVAAACGMSTDEVVERHSGPTYQCAFCGFAPGFGYLTGLDPALHLPRRSTPRTRVPAGSVAIAATYSAVYPSISPGGWHLIGQTDAAMWDSAREEPALVRPGTLVRFVVA
jgi:KipI family sensor histidine kinase inhibitor